MIDQLSVENNRFLFRSSAVVVKIYSLHFPKQICQGIKTTEYPGVNLGDLSAACITRPATCGSDGGTVSLWLKVESCDSDGGALTTSEYFYDDILYYTYPTEGFIIACRDTKLQ